MPDESGAAGVPVPPPTQPDGVAVARWSLAFQAAVVDAAFTSAAAALRMTRSAATAGGRIASRVAVPLAARPPAPAAPAAPALVAAPAEPVELPAPAPDGGIAAAGWDAAAPAVADLPRPEETSTAAEPPVPLWDQLTLASIRGRLRTYELPQLRALLDYEVAHAARPAVIQMLEARIAKVDGRGEDFVSARSQTVIGTEGAEPVSPVEGSMRD